ncbi:MAG: 1-phosphofructokinase, partial [Eubacterium sp.]
MIYTVTLNPALDYVISLEGALTPGSINRTDTEAIVLGGKGINVSTILHNLGEDTKALGFVAGFTGDALESGLAAKGIASDFIHLEQGMTRINVKVKADRETEINGKGPEIPEEARTQLFAKLEKLTAEDVLVLSGSIPKSMPSNIYEQILAHIRENQVMTVVDTTGEMLMKILKYHPFLIKPNHIELGELFGVTLKSEEEIIAYAGRLQQLGARNVLVSMAGDGAILVDENGGHCRQAPCSGTVRNSVGAGDSMVAGFLSGYLRTGDYRYALQLGTAAGGATAFSVGIA